MSNLLYLNPSLWENLAEKEEVCIAVLAHPAPLVNYKKSSSWQHGQEPRHIAYVAHPSWRQPPFIPLSRIVVILGKGGRCTGRWALGGPWKDAFPEKKKEKEKKGYPRMNVNSFALRWEEAPGRGSALGVINCPPLAPPQCAQNSLDPFWIQ